MALAKADQIERLIDRADETNFKLEQLLALSERRLARVEAREKQFAATVSRPDYAQDAVRALNLALGLPDHPYWTNRITSKTVKELHKLNLITAGCVDGEIPF